MPKIVIAALKAKAINYVSGASLARASSVQ